MPTLPQPFDCAPFIKEIGRGARGARGLSRDDTFHLYQAILTGRVSAVELGAVLMAYRIKGETAEELAGMCDAADACTTKLHVPSGTTPVVIASYNGARRQANLIPLLAQLLARDGIPVLIHGVRHEAGRVTTAEILESMGIAPADDVGQAETQLAERNLAFMETRALNPALADQLALRSTLGVRNSSHTVVKLMQPFTGPALRLANYTHPPYRDTLVEYFTNIQPAPSPGVLLARGTEGEAVADTRLSRETLWLREGKVETLIEARRSNPNGRSQAMPQAISENADPAAAPMQQARAESGLPASLEAADTADWIRQVLAGTITVPAPIAAQVASIAHVVRSAR